MCHNPPEAAAIAIIYREWSRTERTEAWEALGAVLASYVRIMGGWSDVHQFCSDFLPCIPIYHLKLAYADQQLRSARAALIN